MVKRSSGQIREVRGDLEKLGVRAEHITPIITSARPSFFVEALRPTVGNVCSPTKMDLKKLGVGAEHDHAILSSLDPGFV